MQGHMLHVPRWKPWRCNYGVHLEKVHKVMISLYLLSLWILVEDFEFLSRFSQVQSLHKNLSTVHKQLYLHGIFPSLLETSFFNRFILKFRHTAWHNLRLSVVPGNNPKLLKQGVFGHLNCLNFWLGKFWMEVLIDTPPGSANKHFHFELQY